VSLKASWPLLARIRSASGCAWEFEPAFAAASRSITQHLERLT
jgi:hypothetical protein